MRWLTKREDGVSRKKGRKVGIMSHDGAFRMRRAAPFGTAVLLLAAAACGAPKQPIRPPVPVSPDIAIVGASLWDGTGRAPVPNAVTLVRGERIVCAGAVGECAVPKGARVIDAQGQYLIPGLIDSHVHLLFLVAGSASEQMGLDLRDYLAQGVTTVRDMGTNPSRAARPGAGAAGCAAGLRDAARGRPAVLLQRVERLPADPHRARRGVSTSRRR